MNPEIPVTVIGVGSNLLVRDGGIEGVTIRLSAKGFGQAIAEPGNRIRAGAALPDKRLAAFALEQGLAGFEFFHGIPGTVGGALRMNAGANGGETRERLVEAHAVDRSGARHALTNGDMGFTYRHSAAPEDLIFTEAVFAGVPAEASAIKAAMDAVEEHRERAQPIREKTGGSTFTNPPGNKAWQLIDAAGCRGLHVGGAMVSEMHCNFLINTGAATATDLERLGETVRARVLASRRRAARMGDQAGRALSGRRGGRAVSRHAAGSRLAENRSPPVGSDSSILAPFGRSWLTIVNHFRRHMAL